MRPFFVFLPALLLAVACAQPAPVVTPTPVPAPAPPTGPTSWLVGDAADVTRPTTAGLLLMGGGTDVDPAMRWLLRQSGGGDVVVLRASGTDGYNTYLFSELGETVNSVETMLLNSARWVNDEAVVGRIRNAEALFIAGGDQADYVRYWKDTKIEEAINYLINTKKVPVGGTSAGCAILGQVYYPALNQSLTAAEGLANPYHPNLMLGREDFLVAPFLTNTITDTHFSERNRQGRLLAFLARMRQDWSLTPARGIGIGERTAVCIGPMGRAQVFGSGTAWFATANTAALPEQCVAGKPLNWVANKQAVRVLEIGGTATGTGTFEMGTWTMPAGTLPTYWYAIEGTWQQN